jgi:hypothetical protein
MAQFCQKTNSALPYNPAYLILHYEAITHNSTPLIRMSGSVNPEFPA